jgi:hypothetical protein
MDGSTNFMFETLPTANPKRADSYRRGQPEGFWFSANFGASVFRSSAFDGIAFSRITMLEITIDCDIYRFSITKPNIN